MATRTRFKPIVITGGLDPKAATARVKPQMRVMGWRSGDRCDHCGSSQWTVGRIVAACAIPGCCNALPIDAGQALAVIVREA